MNTELLEKVAVSIDTKGKYALGSCFNNFEKEQIACRALASCAHNLKENGDSISWMSESLSYDAPDHDCKTACEYLDRHSYIKFDPYGGHLVAPEDVVHENGLPVVLRVTDKLIWFAAHIMKLVSDEEYNQFKKI